MARGAGGEAGGDAGELGEDGGVEGVGVALGVDVPPDPDPGGGDVGVAVGVAGGVAGAFGAVMVTAADAFGTLARSAALAVTVSRTDFTAAALTGTVSCAWSWRGADFALIKPRSHRDVPSASPQPKLNPGVSPAAGVARSWMTASGTMALRAQTLTVQRAGWPRSMLRCAWTTLTQRLAGTVCATVLAATLGAPPASVRVGTAVGVPEPDGPVLGDAEGGPAGLGRRRAGGWRSACGRRRLARRRHRRPQRLAGLAGRPGREARRRRGGRYAGYDGRGSGRQQDTPCH